MSGFTKLPKTSLPNGFNAERFRKNTVENFLTGTFAHGPNIEERTQGLKKELEKSFIPTVPK